MTLEQLKKWATDLRPRLPTSPVIDFLVAQYRGEGTSYSPEAIVRAIGPERRADVMATLLLLDGEPKNILRSQWVFFDDEGEQFDVSKDELAQILKDDEYYHPLTGTRVYNYRQTIALIYESGQTLDELLRHSRTTAQRLSYG